MFATLAVFSCYWLVVRYEIRYRLIWLIALLACSAPFLYRLNMTKAPPFAIIFLVFGTLKQQPHLSRHPFGRIPAFEHDGWMLYETRAIMRYVDAVVPGPRLQPEEPRAAARMDQLMNITDWYLMPQVSAKITFNRVVAPRFRRSRAP